MSKTAIFPGSFAPFTIGHADIVERGLQLFDQLIIAIGFNEQKAGSDAALQASLKCDVEERVNAIAALYANEPRIQVISYSCLTADVAKQYKVDAILRSIRSIKDYEYEMQMADINRRLTGIETVVLFARPELACISSSMVRELQHFGHNISEFIPQ